MANVQKVHMDKALSNISIGYANEQLIAGEVFPEVIVDKQSDRYYKYGMEMFRAVDDHRAPGTEANEITRTLSDDGYFADGHALKEFIPDEEIQNADSEFDLKADAVEHVTGRILLNKEIDAASKILDGSNYHKDLVLTLGGSDAPNKWSDFDNSDPILDVQRARQSIHLKSGLQPNVMIMSQTVYNVLMLHPKLKGLMSHNKDQFVTKELMKAAFNVDKILVGSALKSVETNKGQNEPGEPEALNYIWGNSVVLAYIPTTPRKKTPSLGYSFMWNKDGNGAVQVREWYDEARRSTMVEAERWYDQKMVSNIAGFLMADAVNPLGQAE